MVAQLPRLLNLSSPPSLPGVLIPGELPNQPLECESPCRGSVMSNTRPPGLKPSGSWLTSLYHHQEDYPPSLSASGPPAPLIPTAATQAPTEPPLSSDPDSTRGQIPPPEPHSPP